MEKSAVLESRCAPEMRTHLSLHLEAGIMLIHCEIKGGNSIRIQMKDMLEELNWSHPTVEVHRAAAAKMRSGLRSVLGGKSHSTSSAEERANITNDIRAFLGENSPYRVDVGRITVGLGEKGSMGQPKWMPNGQLTMDHWMKGRRCAQQCHAAGQHRLIS